MDVAHLRLVGKLVGQQAVQLLGTDDANRSQHYIRCPERRIGSNDFCGSFVEQLCAFDWSSFENYGAIIGDFIAVDGRTIFLFESADFDDDEITVRLVGYPRSLRKAMSSNQTTSSKVSPEDEMGYLNKLKAMCEFIAGINAFEMLELVEDDAAEFFDPPPGSDTAVIAEHIERLHRYRGEDYFAVPAMIMVAIDPSETYVQRTVEVDHENKFYQLNVVERTALSRRKNLDVKTFQPLFPGGRIWAVDAGPTSDDDDNFRLVHLLMYVITSKDILIEHLEQWPLKNKTFKVTSLWEEHQKRQLVEGVVVVDDFLSDNFRNSLNVQLDTLAQKQERDQGIDYHPLSTHVVRNLVHPSLYSYIQDVSPLTASVDDVEPSNSSDEQESDDVEPSNSSDEQESEKDFWGRSYESSKYQWLPSYISISDKGKCTFDTYINNLTPRENPVHSVLYKSLETFLDHARPFIESVLSYVYAIRPLVRDEDPDESDDDSDALSPLTVPHISLCGQRLQVIPKIVDYELTSQHDTYEGVWHVDGMSHEEIVLTCLYILDRDVMIQGGEVEFNRAFFEDEAQHLLSSKDLRPPVHLDLVLEDGLFPLGTVTTPKGRLIVFPNSHVHRVKQIKLVLQQNNNDGDESNGADVPSTVAKIRIVVFFVVNPLKRIVSTREVPPQQVHSGGRLAHEDALKHRLALMAERKDRKQDWNVRPIFVYDYR